MEEKYFLTFSRSLLSHVSLVGNLMDYMLVSYHYHDSDISRTFDNPKNDPANNELIKISPLIL